MTNSPAEDSQSEHYQTRDIYLASVIKACGIPLVRIEAHTGRGFFVFKYFPKIEDIIADYHNGNLLLDARSLFNTWKDLKSLAYSAVEKNQNGGKNGNNNWSTRR